MLDIAKILWDVSKGLFDARGKLASARRDRRDRVATYIDKLAELIEKVAASLRLNQYPHGSCAELHALGERMEQTLMGLLPNEEARLYQSEVLKIWEIEQLFGQLQGMTREKAESKLIQLLEAAGNFRAIAAHLRVTAS